MIELGFLKLVGAPNKERGYNKINLEVIKFGYLLASTTHLPFVHTKYIRSLYKTLLYGVQLYIKLVCFFCFLNKEKKNQVSFL